MLKKLLLLPALLCMLLCTAALAEENPYDLIENAMYRIVLRTEEGDEILGSGVLFGDRQMLLTSSGCTAEGSLYAQGAQGVYAIRTAVILDQTGLALMELAQPADGEPLLLAASDASGLACIFGIDTQGDYILAPLYQVRETIYQGQSALLLNASEGLLPGGILCDDKGDIIGLNVARHTEGRGAYIALDANNLYRNIARHQYADLFLPASSAWEGGVLTISWEDEPRGSGVYLITVSADDNQYYTYFEAPHEDRSIALTLPPAHRYDYQVQWAASAQAAKEPVWAAMNEAFVPGERGLGYNFRQECGFVTRAGSKGMLNHIQEVTPDVLSDPAVSRFLHVKATYDVDEEVRLPMTIELLCPQGQFYFESAQCILTPERARNDAFLLPLDDLLKDCAEFSGGSLPLGTYRLRCSIAGCTAAEYTFSLSDGEPLEGIDPGHAVSGFVTGLSASYQDSLLTLTWPVENVPEGATVCCYYMYGGNTFYSYQPLPRSSNQAQIYTVPGRETIVWVTWSLDLAAPALMPGDAQDLYYFQAVPEAPLTDHGFANLRLSVVPSADPDADERGEYLPEAPLTREILSDRDIILYFQTEDTYRIDQNDDDHPLSLVLFTPDGMCYLDPSVYLYDVSLQTSDLWLKDVSLLFENHEIMAGDEAWPAGEYRLVYYIDGKTAGEILFTLD